MIELEKDRGLVGLNNAQGRAKELTQCQLTVGFNSATYDGASNGSTGQLLVHVTVQSLSPSRSSPIAI